MSDNSGEMIKYIDHIAYMLRMQAAATLTVEENPNWDLYDKYVYSGGYREERGILPEQ